jgi:hypothetical protein
MMLSARSPMEDRQEHRLGCRLEQPLERGYRGIDTPLHDGIAQCPDRRWRGLGDERADVCGG